MEKIIIYYSYLKQLIVFALSVCPSQFVSANPLKLRNRISWNLVGSKDTICSCAYYQEILIAWILWELCPFELKNLPKYTTIKYGIEYVAVHVKSPQIFVINIYRPPDLPVKYFCDALNRLLKDLTPGIPQIVMGDFNVDLLSRKDDVITRTFSAFEQNIKSSTTRKLTCLDHIYTRHLNAQQAGVVPIYYSYHDMTYISVDMQQLQ